LTTISGCCGDPRPAYFLTEATTPEGHEYRITISYCKTCGSQKATSNIKHVK